MFIGQTPRAVESTGGRNWQFGGDDVGFHPRFSGLGPALCVNKTANGRIGAVFSRAEADGREFMVDTRVDVKCRAERQSAP